MERPRRPGGRRSPAAVRGAAGPGVSRVLPRTGRSA